ncbi:5-(carboxyamino)imidazole ribonucleotide synthase [Stella humosa]|uniref:N5-carboxyaminoimidazole ribonucleotide synthase n=1 Tax=Stella humosa TaxID=94 RepID=A0A3N1MLQ1_9PROT|nr:5-(carboxyamino)imidazole ribonucleotide synthase [Stella humosa]ROQ03300.1 5-(carboxyamino)imidazole ribonucleotide synthase [Stella humosa]BBK33329.1 N5-carboxyaminoimidazole ribonucleotide synthase [Stella humosa]
MTTAPAPIAPGATIGILGGGQLGRMLAMAAAALGYRAHVFVPDQDSPTAQVAAAATVAPYDDLDALTRFAAAVDVVTFEFENVPAATAAHLANLRPIHPSPRVLSIAQDRLAEKRFLNGIGVPTAPFREVANLTDLEMALAELGRPAVLKTVRLGYDGKGQTVIRRGDDSAVALRALGGALGVLEGFVDFRMEASVVVARTPTGETAHFVPVENRHVHHILDTTIAPADIPAALAEEAVAIACDIARGLDLVGLLAVEMFVTGDDRILVNELAPRPHNSGHWTMDACRTSQFEQHVRAVCGLPLGSTERHSDAVMKNLIGDEVAGWPGFLADPTAKLHLYGKAEARPGRKMGHVNYLRPRTGA